MHKNSCKSRPSFPCMPGQASLWHPGPRLPTSGCPQAPRTWSGFPLAQALTRKMSRMTSCLISILYFYYYRETRYRWEKLFSYRGKVIMRSESLCTSIWTLCYTCSYTICLYLYLCLGPRDQLGPRVCVFITHMIFTLLKGCKRRGEFSLTSNCLL